VSCNGEKIGVYKDDTGAIFTVSTKCPHLGCRLEWNPDEKCWECPCHGSRFDYKGRLIDDPAQNDLEGNDYAQFLRQR
jgi:Rieske Fe-S protein